MFTSEDEKKDSTSRGKWRENKKKNLNEFFIIYYI